MIWVLTTLVVVLFFSWDEAGIIISIASTCESFIKGKCFLEASLCSLCCVWIELGSTHSDQVNKCDHTFYLCLFIYFSFVSMTLKTLHAKGRQSERKDCHVPEYILHDTTPPTRPHSKGPILQPFALQVSSISGTFQILFWKEPPPPPTYLALCLSLHTQIPSFYFLFSLPWSTSIALWW